MQERCSAVKKTIFSRIVRAPNQFIHIIMGLGLNLIQIVGTCTYTHSIVEPTNHRIQGTALADFNVLACTQALYMKGIKSQCYMKFNGKRCLVPYSY